MKIGTDGSIVECRNEGYTVIEFAKNKLFKNGILDKDFPVHVTISNPYNWENGKPLIGYKKEDLYLYDTYYSFNDAFEVYCTYKDAIDSFADLKNCPIEMDNPSEYDLLHLIDVVSHYCGLD